MNDEQFKQHRQYAGEKKPSMLRRRVGHDYESRRIYLITLTVEGRRPLLGRLVGQPEAEDGDPHAPHIELTELGERVRDCWLNTSRIYPQISVLALQVMPDHLHGILFVREQLDRHLGQVIKGFKTGCNKAYRELGFARAKSTEAQSTERQSTESTEAASTEAATLSQQSRRQSQQQSLPTAQPSCQQAEASGYAATVSQSSSLTVQKRDRSLDDRQHGQLWAIGYNDHILSGAGELERWKQYLRDNPRRLAIRRAHADYFRVCFGITIGKQTYAAIGNRFLLKYPRKAQVQLTRSLTEAQIQEKVDDFLSLARSGVVLVSPAISKGEQLVMRAVLDAHLPLIFLSPWGFNSYSRPGHQFYEACAAGRFLILAPWPHENRRMPLTRAMCLALNSMVEEIVSK